MRPRQPAHPTLRKQTAHPRPERRPLRQPFALSRLRERGGVRSGAPKPRPGTLPLPQPIALSRLRERGGVRSGAPQRASGRPPKPVPTTSDPAGGAGRQVPRERYHRDTSRSGVRNVHELVPKRHGANAGQALLMKRPGFSCRRFSQVLTRRQLIATGGYGGGDVAVDATPAAQAAGPPMRLIMFPLLNGAEPRFFWPNPGNLAAMSLVTEPLKAYQQPDHLRARHQHRPGSINHMAVRSIFTRRHHRRLPVARPDREVGRPGDGRSHRGQRRRPSCARCTWGSSRPTRSSFISATGARPSSSRPSRSTTRPTRCRRSTAPSRAERRARARAPPGPRPPPGAPTPPAPARAGQLRERRARHRRRRADRPGASGWAHRARELAKLDQHRQALQRPAPHARWRSPPRPWCRRNPIDAAADRSARAAAMGGTAGCDADALPSVEKLRAALQGKDARRLPAPVLLGHLRRPDRHPGRAVVCGLTRVATIQAGSADGNVTDPVGPGLPAPQHLARQPGHLRPVPEVVRDQVRRA